MARTREKESPFEAPGKDATQAELMAYRAKKELWRVLNKHDISNEDMADLLGVEIGTFKTWIYNAERKLSNDAILALAQMEGLGYDLDYVFKGEESRV